MNTYLPLILLFLIPSIGFAQQQKTLHQTFEIEDVERLTFNLVDEIEVEKWAGNTILTETKIEVHDATKGIFDHFVNGGRYEILLSDSPGSKVAKTSQYNVNEDYFNDGPSASSDVEEAPIEEPVETVAAQPKAGTVYLNSKDSERKAIATRSGACLEIVKVRIFIPDDFNRSSENSYFRTLPKDDDED